MVSVEKGLYGMIMDIINKNTKGQWIHRVSFMKDLNEMFEIEGSDKIMKTENWPKSPPMVLKGSLNNDCAKGCGALISVDPSRADSESWQCGQYYDALNTTIYCAECGESVKDGEN